MKKLSHTILYINKKLHISIKSLFEQKCISRIETKNLHILKIKIHLMTETNLKEVKFSGL